MPPKEESFVKNNAQMRKGILEYCILLILNQKRSYSADLLQALKDHDLIVVEGTLYPLLSRLRKEGVLDYDWEENTQGPPRKYYVLTEKGYKWLCELSATWRIMRDAILDLEQATGNYPTPAPFQKREGDRLFNRLSDNSTANEADDTAPEAEDGSGDEATVTE